MAQKEVTGQEAEQIAAELHAGMNLRSGYSLHRGRIYKVSADEVAFVEQQQKAEAKRVEALRKALDPEDAANLIEVPDTERKPVVVTPTGAVAVTPGKKD